MGNVIIAILFSYIKVTFSYIIFVWSSFLPVHIFNAHSIHARQSQALKNHSISMLCRKISCYGQKRFFSRSPFSGLHKFELHLNNIIYNNPFLVIVVETDTMCKLNDAAFVCILCAVCRKLTPLVSSAMRSSLLTLAYLFCPPNFVIWYL